MGLDDDCEWLGGCRCLQRDTQAWFVISTWEGEGMGWEGMGDVDHTYHTWFCWITTVTFGRVVFTDDSTSRIACSLAAHSDITRQNMHLEPSSQLYCQT